MFSGSTVPPVSKGIELGTSKQKASPAAGKNNRVVLVPCHSWKCIPTAISSGVNISENPGVSFVITEEFSVRGVLCYLIKIFVICFLLASLLTLLIMLMTPLPQM